MWEGACSNASQLRLCRSELARKKLTGAAFIQKPRFIVDGFREQARSYQGLLSRRYTQPPSTIKFCAEHIAEASEAKNSAMLAMCSGITLPGRH